MCNMCEMYYYQVIIFLILNYLSQIHALKKEGVDQA